MAGAYPSMHWKRDRSHTLVDLPKNKLCKLEQEAPWLTFDPLGLIMTLICIVRAQSRRQSVDLVWSLSDVNTVNLGSHHISVSHDRNIDLYVILTGNILYVI